MLSGPCSSVCLGVGAHSVFLSIPLNTLMSYPTTLPSCQSCFCEGRCISLYTSLQLGMIFNIDPYYHFWSLYGIGNKAHWRWFWLQSGREIVVSFIQQRRGSTVCALCVKWRAKLSRLLDSWSSQLSRGHRPPLGKQILEENGKHTVTKKNCDFISIFNIPYK